MARIESIRHRLENWALWKAKGRLGGIGYASVNILASDTWSRGRYAGMSIPVMDIEAAETDEAVQALKLSGSHLFVTLELVYIKGVGVMEASRRMCRSVSAVHVQLAQADKAIQEYLMRKAEDRERKRAAAAAGGKNSFTP